MAPPSSSSAAAEQPARQVGCVAGLGAPGEVVGRGAGADVGEPPFEIGVGPAQAGRGKAARLELPGVVRAAGEAKLGPHLGPRDRADAGGARGARGALPRLWIVHLDGTIAVASPAKEVRRMMYAGRERDFVLEESITTDFALLHAWRGDRHGNLVFRKATRNFSPLAAMAGRTCIVQVEELVEPGQIDPDAVHLPGVYVSRVLEVGGDIEKRIEKRTVSSAKES